MSLASSQPLTAEQQAILASVGEARRAELLAVLPYITGFPMQDERGVDTSLIASNLRLTPAERLERSYAARQQTLALLEAGKRKHGIDLRDPA